MSAQKTTITSNQDDSNTMLKRIQVGLNEWTSKIDAHIKSSTKKEDSQTWTAILNGMKTFQETINSLIVFNNSSNKNEINALEKDFHLACSGMKQYI